MGAKLIVFIAAAFLLAACESPEVKRARGTGRGADLGYRGSSVDMHEGAEPYYQTPQLIDSRHARSRDDKTADRVNRQ